MLSGAMEELARDLLDDLLVSVTYEQNDFWLSHWRQVDISNPNNVAMFDPMGGIGLGTLVSRYIRPRPREVLMVSVNPWPPGVALMVCFRKGGIPLRGAGSHGTPASPANEQSRQRVGAPRRQFLRGSPLAHS